jgi:hypothetical protein
MLRSFRMSVVVLGLLMVVPAAASADKYVVASCHDTKPNAASGWVTFATGVGVTGNTCAANGALTAALNADKPPGNSTADWRFTAPPGTRIVRVVANRTTSGFGPSTQSPDIAYLMRTESQELEKCEPSGSSSCVSDLTAPLDKQGLDAGYLEFRVLCTNIARTCTRRVGVTATAMHITLRDVLAPAVSNPRVIDDGDSSGKLRVRFNAADVGGGLYRTIVKIDGKVAQTAPLAPAPCADVDPSDGDPYQFNVPVPCPGAVTDADATVDVRSLPAGPHGVEIAVEDAAGNQTPVYGPIEYPRANTLTGSSVPIAEALRGRLRMWFVKAKASDRRRYVSRFGTRVVTRGLLLTPSGRGIQGARIDVYHIRRDGTRRLLKTGLKSRQGGKLTLILPLNVDTRTIEFAFRALRPGPVTSRQRLSLTVRTRSGRVYYRKSKR